MTDEALDQIREQLNKYRYSIALSGDALTLRKWAMDLLRRIDELTAERDEAEKFTKLGRMFADIVEGFCDRDELPEADKNDAAINGWLRMRAARDEALADVKRLTAELAAANQLNEHIREMLRSQTEATQEAVERVAQAATRERERVTRIWRDAVAYTGGDGEHLIAEMAERNLASDALSRPEPQEPPSGEGG